jgi:hypothetical protein
VLRRIKRLVWDCSWHDSHFFICNACLSCLFHADAKIEALFRGRLKKKTATGLRRESGGIPAEVQIFLGASKISA